MKYHWWSIFGWWQARDKGLKLGPVTVCVMYGHACIFVLGYPVYDGVMRQLRRGPRT